MGELAGAIVELEKIAQKIGANRLGSFSGTIEQMIKRGFIEKPKPGNVIRTTDGKVVFMYIDDNANFDRDLLSRNKVHVFYCSAISRMDNKGIANQRYKAETVVSNDGMFRMANGRMLKLNLCEHCFRKVKSRKYGNPTNFAFADFAKERYVAPKNKLKPRSGPINNNIGIFD